MKLNGGYGSKFVVVLAVLFSMRCGADEILKLTDAYGTDGFQLVKQGDSVVVSGGCRGLIYGKNEWERR